MNKDEILELSRAEHKDERDEEIRKQSNKWAFLSMAFIAAIFSIIRAVKGETILDLAITVCSPIAVTNFYQYRFTKKADNLISGIIIAVAAAICLVVYCMRR